MTSIHTLSFSINQWNHLYSLQQAITRNQQLSGSKLTISGNILKVDFLQQHDTKISINFLQLETSPAYPLTDSGAHVLGMMSLSNNSLSADIKVDRSVFEELRKNLMEYADIEGIHIMLTLGLQSSNDYWQEGESLAIIQLDYAMKGDA